MQVSFISFLVVLVSLVLHEVAHAYAADRLGDLTPRMRGRLTLNPIPHLDLMGSIILPLLLFLMQSPVLFGWAKPVPFRPDVFKNPKLGTAIVAFAGPFINILLAVVAALVLRTLDFSGLGYTFFSMTVGINVVLAIFNLVPIPPLDGHHILGAVLPHRWYVKFMSLRKYTPIIMVVFLLFGWRFIQPIAYSIINFLL